MKERIDQYNMCLDEYEANTKNSETYFKRAIGELPEMECSKALASLLGPVVGNESTILDVGCAVGHYYRSLKKSIDKNFYYTGCDPYPILIEKAQQAWKKEKRVQFKIGNIFDLPFEKHSFDYVICNNVILHLPEIEKPIGELLRVSKKKVIIRHTLNDKSYKIQFVYNNTWWPFTEVKPAEEFDGGNPRAFSYFNIHSFDYFSSVIKRHRGDAEVEYIKDDMFNVDNINYSSETEGFIEPTKVLDGIQVNGCLLQHHYFVIISLPE